MLGGLVVLCLVESTDCMNVSSHFQAIWKSIWRLNIYRAVFALTEQLT